MWRGKPFNSSILDVISIHCKQGIGSQLGVYIGLTLSLNHSSNIWWCKIPFQTPCEPNKHTWPHSAGFAHRRILASSCTPASSQLIWTAQPGIQNPCWSGTILVRHPTNLELDLRIKYMENTNHAVNCDLAIIFWTTPNKWKTDWDLDGIWWYMMVSGELVMCCLHFWGLRWCSSIWYFNSIHDWKG